MIAVELVSHCSYISPKPSDRLCLMTERQIDLAGTNIDAEVYDVYTNPGKETGDRAEFM